MDFEARLGDVLVRLKPTDLGDLAYSSQPKAVDFERWAQLTRMNLESRHSQLVLWWDVMLSNAQAAYSTYLQLPPLRRSEVRPTMEGFTATTLQVERYMRCHVLRAMPAHVQSTLLHMSNVACVDVLYQVLTDAGPGTEIDRANTLKSVVQLGSQPPVAAIYDRLRAWRFNIARRASLGVALPDPSDQRNVLVHCVGKLAESDRAFDYRLNAYLMTRYLQGAVAQAQVDDLWRYLVAEAREHHGDKPPPSRIRPKR